MSYSDSNAVVDFQVTMICDESKTEGGTTSTLELANGVYSTSLSSSAGCDVFSMNALWTWASKYYYIWGAVFIGLGVFLTFLGYRVF